MLVVFATNIKPTELVDEAFLRRIQYKVLAESPTVEEFSDIFEGCCSAARSCLTTTASSNGCSIDFYRPRGIALRGCHPRDLIKQALSLAYYLSQPRQLTVELLEAACEGYFVDDAEPAPTYA